MTDDFPSSLAHVLATEGGYVNDPKDPGGPTMQGVTQKEYDLWRVANRQPVRSVRLIDPNEIEAIYRKCYWVACRAGQLPSGVDYCVFDCAVNSGPHEASKLLQLAVGTDDDGFLGPVTLTAVNAADAVKLIDTFSAERLAYLQKLPGWAHDGIGWSRRVTSVKFTAKAMVTAPAK